MKKPYMVGLCAMALQTVTSFNYCEGVPIQRSYSETADRFGLAVSHGPITTDGATLMRTDLGEVLVDRHTVELGSFWRAQGHGVTLEMFPVEETIK
jgi:hypothetical protein